MNLNKKISKLNKEIDKLLSKTKQKQTDKTILWIWGIWIVGGIFAGSVFVVKFVMIFMEL